MSIIKNTNILQFNLATAENVRREFNLDKPGAMDQAIDILHDWVCKQEHFVKKDFSREYLERFIISSKGAVETAKARMDKLCTMRTTVPHLFEMCHARNDFPVLRDFFIDIFMPSLTEDDCRIHIGKFMSKNITFSAFLDIFRHFGIMCEYAKLHDYVKGYHTVYDLRDTDINDLITNLDWVNFRYILTMIIEAYGFRIMSIHIITSSKTVYALLNIVKQFLSANICKRIRVLKTMESLHDYLPKRLLPKDFGGEQKTILDIFAREYLERFIISAKGSVEKAKTRIDKLLTMRTMVPNLTEKTHAKNDFPNLRNFFINVLMPKLSEDNYRIHIGKCMSKDITPAACLDAYRHCRIILEYFKMYDYAMGYHVIYDITDVNITDIITNVDWIDFRNAINFVIEGFGFRIRSIFLISSSKVINALVNIIKPMLSEKIANRIHILKNVESIHDFFPKNLLPKDFGGSLKSVLELYDDMNDALCSEAHIAHLEAMRDARTDEKLRRADTFNNEYLGMPGSFKMLSVD